MNTNTEQKTVYILQKDLPDFKAGTKYTRKKFFHFSGDEVSYFPNTKELDSTSVRGIHKDYVENNPEWFLPEQPKEWEIVARIDENAMTDIPNANIVKKGDIGWVYAELRNYPIHSVRRLSDGETFSVGEFIDDGQILSFDNNERLGAIVCKTESEKRGHSRFMMNERVRKAPLPPPTPKEETVKVDEKSKIVSQLDMYNMGYKDAIKYTDAIILETQRKAFEAAREYNTNPNTFYPKPIFEPRLTYPTFADYIQSLKK